MILSVTIWIAHSMTDRIMEWAIQIVTDRTIKPWRTVYDPVRPYLDSSFHDGQDLHSDGQDHKLSVMVSWSCPSLSGSCFYDPVRHYLDSSFQIVTDRIINCPSWFYDPVRHYLDSSFHDGHDLYSDGTHSMTDRIFIVTDRIINCPSWFYDPVR